MKNDTSGACENDAELEDTGPWTPRTSMVVPKSRQETGNPPSVRPGIGRVPDLEPPRPDLLCPFSSGFNPLVVDVQPASVDWAIRMGLVAPEVRARLDAASLALLEGLVFHTASREVLQLAADWTTLFCLLDDRVELDGLGPVALSAYLSRVLSGFRGVEPPHGDPIGHGFADLRRRMTLLASAAWIERFANHLEDLFAAYIWEELNRWKRIRPSRDAYRTMRAVTIGLRPQFLFGELALGVDGAELLRKHDALRELELLTSNCVGWANDVFTYEKELESGEIHNLVFVLMESDSLPISEAVRRAAGIHDEDVRKFLYVQSQFRGLGGDDGAKRYVGMLRSWIRGHLDWSRETGRYRPASRQGPAEVRVAGAGR